MIAFVLDRTSAMKDCPLNPGWTLITRTRSNASATPSRASSGVSGLMAIPADMPRAWQRSRNSSGESSVSTCPVQWLAPAAANGSRYASGSVTIRCTSMKASTARRTPAQIAGPIERLGTKCPSMTST